MIYIYILQYGVVLVVINLAKLKSISIQNVLRQLQCRLSVTCAIH